MDSVQDSRQTRQGAHTHTHTHTHVNKDIVPNAMRFGVLDTYPLEPIPEESTDRYCYYCAVPLVNSLLFGARIREAAK
jgi:hypothetical protein